LLQLSCVHALASSQTSGSPSRHVPAVHASDPSHALPSMHPVPSITAVFVHPEAGLQPSIVHALPSPQLRASLWQAPPTQRSFTVQASASTQSPSVKQQLATAVCVHPVLVLHPSAVQGLPSLQSGGADTTQLPA
jgi:hypothetical protein